MFKQKSSLWLVWAALTMAVFVVYLGGCDSSSSSGGDDTVVPGGLDVTVTAAPTSINTDNYTVVEAYVESNSVGVVGQEVTFTVSPSNAGYCTPTIDTTDADGVAATMFTPTTTGTVTITANVSGESLTGSVAVTVSEEGTSGTGGLSMSVSPTLLIANGEDTARVTISVRDANNAPAADSTLVKICAGEKFVDLDGNGYWSDGVDSLVFDPNENDQWDAVGVIPSYAYTGGGTGTASVDFISGAQAGTFYIKATVDEGGISGSAEQSIQLNPDANLNSIFLSSSVYSIVVTQTGGIETAYLSATGYDVSGNPVPEGMSITFTILDGPDGGEFLGTDPLVTEVEVLTNSQGVARVPIHSGTTSGTVRVRAFAGTVLSNATQILISAGPPTYIVIGVEKLNVPWFYTVNERQDVVAVVSDQYLNPVNDNTVVYFSCDEGTMKAYETVTNDMEGVAMTEWISGNNVETADGQVWIWAETAGGTVRCSTYFYNSHVAYSVFAAPSTISLNAGSGASGMILISAIDVNGNPLVSGTTIDFEAGQYILVERAILEDGYTHCSDYVEVTATKVLDMDYSLSGSIDDSVGAVVYIFAEVDGGLDLIFNTVLRTGPAYLENCKMTIPTSVDPGTEVPISASIADRWGNPLGDHTLVLTSPGGGNPIDDTQDTDAYGEAMGFLWEAPPGGGSYTLTITDTDPAGGVILTETITVNDTSSTK